MGVKNSNCCYKIENNLHSEVLIPEDSSVNEITGYGLLKDIKPINDISKCFDFIISGEYYLLLFKIPSPYNLIEKIILELNSDDVLVLIENIINWIKKTESIENKIINETKINLEYGTKRILSEINSLHLKNKIKIPKNIEIKCLGDLSIITQYIKYINFHGKENDYEENFWKGILNIDKEIKIYLYKISYNLIQIKLFVSNKENENKNNGNHIYAKKNSSTRQESMKIYKEIEKFINEMNMKYIGK